MKKSFYLTWVALGCVLFSCYKEYAHPHSYYFWRTTFELNATEKEMLGKAELPFLYTRFFDVDKVNGQFLPVGSIQQGEKPQNTGKTIVPVVFITNRTFLNIRAEERKNLANAVWKWVVAKQKSLGVNTIEELQLDCDWTEGTRDDFFQFIRELEAISKVNITSTLRLHQVKDKEKMGIPPVKKVYLMCYSTSSPLENSDKNSILEVQVLKNYLRTIENYPISEIAVALPNYSWGIVTNVLGKKKLINALSRKNLNQKGLKRTAQNEAVVEQAGFYFGHYLDKGTTIKVEEIRPEQRTEVIQFLNQKLKKPYSIIYYHLDHRFI